ncbi:MAG: ATP-dependent DNA helicase RecG [Mogibacterium sp.]|nr:ATP-dependent DNA helicase RecG [Mogibacterium sp.]
MIKYSLSDDISSLKGIGSKKKEQLTAAGIETIEDLLSYYPVKYKDRRHLVRAVDAGTEKDSLTCGRLIKVQLRPLSGRRSITECTLRDDSCVFYAVFFNMPYLRKNLVTGEDYVLFGRMRIRNGARVWTNPEFSKAGGDRDIRGIFPVYRHSAGLTDINLRKWIREALDNTDLDTDWIGSDIIEKRKICGRDFAFGNIHFPEGEQHYKAARYRLIYEKLLMYQLTVRMNAAGAEDMALDASIPEQDMEAFCSRLPFELTEGQSKCIDEIMNDLGNRKPMNRLVQGDVGCGKTVVAEAAIYRCAKSGLQSAMMVPTGILAKQHFESISKDLSGCGIKCDLLVSGMKASERRRVIDDVASGKTDVLIGTHALIQNDVSFNDLALVITDEQHRFGVAQRKSLIKKGRGVNVCVMSATPIPRTLAATVFGDMDFSIIRSMPEDRKRIITRALDQSTRERAYIDMKRELEKGNRAYVIAPSIDNDDDDMLSVQKLFEEIKSRFPDHKAALLHGRLTGDDKASIMNDFKEGRIQILVSTIVIEVGIDVPEATVIIIENSERFGLAQMHQLRGRVGRSSRQSYCYVINYSRSDAATARAKAMAEISDGFEISEIDYEMRGPGDVMGTMQSGTAASDVLMLSRYTDILEAAIEDADTIMEERMNGRSLTDAEYAYGMMMRSGASDNSNII